MSETLIGPPDDNNFGLINLEAMSPEEVERLQHQLYEKRFSNLTKRVETVEQVISQKEINSRQRKKFRERVNQLIVGYLGGKSSQAYKDPSLRQTAYSRLYNYVYDNFEISEYSDIPANRFKEALALINTWNPDAELRKKVSVINGQGELF